MSTVMAVQDVWEYDSDAFTSLWMLQNTCINGKNTDILRVIDVPELKYILQKPCVYVYYRTPVSSEVTSLLVSTSHVGRKVPRPEELNPKKPTEKPFAVVIVLNPSMKKRKCFLSENDCTMVQQNKNILQHFDNVIYVVKGRCRRVSALQPLSYELQRKIHGDTALNKIFPKIYRFPEDLVDIRTRVGLCIHFSIVEHLQVVYDIILDLQHQISQERGQWNGSRGKLTSYVKKKLSGETFNACSLPLNKSNHKIFEELSRDIHGEISHKKLLGSKLMSNISADRVCCLLEEHIYKVLIGKTPVLKECQGKTNSKTTRQRHSNTARYSYVTKKTSKPSTDSVASTLAVFSNGHKCTDKCIILLNKTEKATVAKEMYTGICTYFNESEDNLSAFCKSLSDELTNRGDSVMLHEWKTVSLRNERVKGFGCMGDTISLYLQRNNIKDEKEVSDYMKNFFDYSALKYDISIKFKSREITLFTSLQQGSKINPEMSNESKKSYGTVGMFLEDEKGTYFFTTCAHVIGENQYAYSNVNNATIGRNVIIRYPDSRTPGSSEEPSLDFSLVEVSPDKTLSCTFGLKTQKGNFINMQIFRGDPLEVRYRTIYKWGASEPNRQVGRCTGCKYDGPFLYLQVDTKEFAKPGDSGAIICVGDNPDQSLAAFVLVGADEESYLVYKVADALELISAVRKEIKPCISHCTKTIQISPSSSCQLGSSQKRKREDRVLEPRPKRLLSSKHN